MCRSRRRPFARSHSLGALTKKLLSSQTGAAGSFPWQVPRGAQAGLPERLLDLLGNLALLAQPKIFAAWLRPLFRQDWVVYLKRPFRASSMLVQYLGRYTHRVAISNHRLISFADGQVTFRWRDSAHNNEQKPKTLSLDKFLCRFLLHILQQGFVRIRNFGFLANRRRATLLPLCFHLLGSKQPPQDEQNVVSHPQTRPSFLATTTCAGPMRVIERLTAAQIQLRSPPAVHRCSPKSTRPNSYSSRASARFATLRLAVGKIHLAFASSTISYTTLFRLNQLLHPRYHPGAPSRSDVANIHTDIFSASHRRVFLSAGVCRKPRNLTSIRGALLY